MAEALVAEGREERQAGAVRQADAAQERGAERGREVREDGVLAVGRRRPLPAPREEGLHLRADGRWESSPVRVRSRVLATAFATSRLCHGTCCPVLATALATPAGHGGVVRAMHTLLPAPARLRGAGGRRGRGRGAAGARIGVSGAEQTLKSFNG